MRGDRVTEPNDAVPYDALRAKRVRDGVRPTARVPPKYGRNFFGDGSYQGLRRGMPALVTMLRFVEKVEQGQSASRT